MARPDGYYHGKSEDGTLTVSENDPGLGACRVHWKPVGNFDEDQVHEFRISMEAWTAVLEQIAYDRNMRHAKADAVAEVAKVKANGSGKTANLPRKEAVPGF